MADSHSASALLTGYYKELIEGGLDHRTASQLVLDAGSRLHSGTCAMEFPLTVDEGAHV